MRRMGVPLPPYHIRPTVCNAYWNRFQWGNWVWQVYHLNLPTTHCWLDHKISDVSKFILARPSICLSPSLPRRRLGFRLNLTQVDLQSLNPYRVEGPVTEGLEPYQTLSLRERKARLRLGLIYHPSKKQIQCVVCDQSEIWDERKNVCGSEIWWDNTIKIIDDGSSKENWFQVINLRQHLDLVHPSEKFIGLQLPLGLPPRSPWMLVSKANI